MSLTVMTFLVVGATFALYIYIAIKSTAKNTSDFYVARSAKLRDRVCGFEFAGGHSDIGFCGIPEIRHKRAGGRA